MAMNPTTLFGAAAQPTGNAFLDQYKDFVAALVDTTILRLSNATGANAITASAEPFSLPASGPKPGMYFWLFSATANTGAVTLDVDGTGAKDVINADGSVLSAGAIVVNTIYLLVFAGTKYRVLTGTSAATGATASRTIYDVTTIWENSLPANTIVQVELWGSGGGGSTNSTTGGGGGGGEYTVALYRAGDLPASVTITVPSGGAPNKDGLNATFGSLVTALKGEKGTSGGGTAITGGNGGGFIGGGQGGGGDPAVSPTDAGTIHAGAGGGAVAMNGANAVYGGAGGAGVIGSSGGLSRFGGDGGAAGVAGQRPGGGGGAAAAGGAGRAIITIFG